MDQENRSNTQPPKMAADFLGSIGPVGSRVPSNTEAYQTALVTLKPVITLLSMPEIQEALKDSSFRYEMSPGWAMTFGGENMLKAVQDPKERLLTRISYAETLLRQLPEKMTSLNGLKEGLILTNMLMQQADVLKLCSDKHSDGTGNLDLTDPESAAKGEISRLQAMLAGKLGLRYMSVVGETHDGQAYREAGTYVINQFDPEIRSPSQP